MIANISSSVVSTGRPNRSNNVFYRNGILRNCNSISCSQNNLRLKCTKPVLICIVSTVLPVTITSLLILGLFMQKNNLHEYAIYTFVIFCLAFIFPFALFFFIVILNKIFKFYKWLTDSSGSNPMAEQYNRRIHNNCRSTLRSDYEINETLNSYNNHIPLSSTVLQNIVVVDVSVEQQITVEDDPPTYEMALLCPTVQLIDRKNILENNQNK